MRLFAGQLPGRHIVDIPGGAGGALPQRSVQRRQDMGVLLPQPRCESLTQQQHCVAAGLVTLILCMWRQGAWCKVRINCVRSSRALPPSAWPSNDLQQQLCAWTIFLLDFDCMRHLPRVSCRERGPWRGHCGGLPQLRAGRHEHGTDDGCSHQQPDHTGIDASAATRPGVSGDRLPSDACDERCLWDGASWATTTPAGWRTAIIAHSCHDDCAVVSHVRRAGERSFHGQDRSSRPGRPQDADRAGPAAVRVFRQGPGPRVRLELSLCTPCCASPWDPRWTLVQLVVLYAHPVAMKRMRP